MIKSRWIAGAFGLMGWIAATSMTACGLRTTESEEPAPAEDPESVAEAEQEVGVGGSCKLLGPFCDPGLTCCGAGAFGTGTCRNLQNDWANCGSCGHSCSVFAHCSSGHCCPFGWNWIDGACRKPCSVPSQCPSGWACCAGAGYCADLQNDPQNCGVCTNDCNCACESGSCVAC